ncbi:DUF2127 domain-containing protein [Pseudonocardia acaciae]|uniref:DUF2127 domain-containing protein n=1 Tax=Pseudonocardia acaciae TaxID=551276 RepID=UPI00048B495C|nr:DUF2127 domain-containing protein [Pseudonocardia acaciae]
MDEPASAPPGVVRPTGWRPRFHYELIACGLGGHELLGMDVARVRPEDALVVREPGDGLRWHRCLRCDAWIPLAPPRGPVTEHLPDRASIRLPLRGRPLRDRYVLRLIALDRLLHFVVLGALAVAVFLFAAERPVLSAEFSRVLDDLQGGVGGPNGLAGNGLVHELRRAFEASSFTLHLVGLVLAGYAVLEGVEAVGLWLGKRWAEYLTFVATSLLLIPEVYELTGRISAPKIITLVINLAVVGYLLYAKRLFGLRGGGGAEARARERDTGWQALERSLPQ